MSDIAVRRFTPSDVKTLTFWMMVVGTVLIIVLPFRVLVHVPESLDVFWRYAAVVVHERPTANPLEIMATPKWWEAVAVIWTTIFLILFYLVDFPNAYAPNVDHRRNMRLTAVLVMSSLIVCLAAGWIYMDGTIPFAALWAKILITSFIVITNFLIISSAKKSDVWDDKKKNEIISQFYTYQWTIDVPALVCFLILLCYASMSTSWAISSSHLNEFVSGAAAVVLLVTNFRFGIAFLRR